LAQELCSRPEFYEIYLVELLSLFTDKGVVIQNIGIENPQLKVCSSYAEARSAELSAQTDDMIEQLASLLLPIDALLKHEDFNPGVNTATLFRQMWFLCVLFGFTTTESTPGSAMDWQGPALSRISNKTPPLVTESKSLASDLEYSPVIKQEYVNNVSRDLMYLVII
jgi:phosphatidylinositol 4-kinase